MLDLIDIKKTYKAGGFETRALDGITVSFREREFVSILGASGSGKTTCLNIIGGLDRYDSGDLLIKGKSTKDFRESDWDAYRNNSIGFVFQSYNLIGHLSIVANVELGMTLSGVPAKEKRARSIEALEKVGLKEHLHKNPNQLSGGQMQRVAIARALANNPEVLLCDEPTGALDSVTSEQILSLIREVAKDRLVIMVTHNGELAERFSDRIIRFSDGKIVSDTRPFENKTGGLVFSLKKTGMSFFTALNLSFNNLRTKKGRTFLTAFASSLGIIGIALILSLSTGFQKQIDQYQRDTLAEYPITISQTTSSVEADVMAANRLDKALKSKQYLPTDEVAIYEQSTIQHTNVFTDEFLNYINAIDPAICDSIGYARAVNINLLRKLNDGTVNPVSFSAGGQRLMSYPTPKTGSESYLEKNYDLMYGSFPTAATDVVLIIDTENRLKTSVMSKLGFDTDGISAIKFSDIAGTELKLIDNSDYYKKTAYGNFIPSADFKAMYDSDKSVTLRICGILRQKENVQVTVLGTGIACSDGLSAIIIDKAKDSAIVNEQKAKDYNVLTLAPVNDSTKKTLIAALGGDETPYAIYIYPTSFESKTAVRSYLDAYNKGKSDADIVIYTDLAETVAKMSSGIMNGITIVLIAFAAISLVVSLIMICIITYTSVLERTKEIGILKALGARRKDISRVFDAETCILGVMSGVIGIFVARLLMIPSNIILYRLTSLKNVAQLRADHAIFLIAISTILTMLGGHIPARIAAKKDAVEALRSE